MRRQDDDEVSGSSQCVPTRENLEQQVRARAKKDKAFRQEFLAHPKAVLERDYAQWLLEGKLTSELLINIIEEDEQTCYFVLPSRSSNDYLSEVEDLDNEELLAVSGG